VKRKTTAQWGKRLPAEEARTKEYERLRRLAQRVRAAAQRIDLAAYYHEDGAYDTARVRLGEATRELVNAVSYLRLKTWHYVDLGR
jgi:hypothetical protein